VREPSAMPEFHVRVGAELHARAVEEARRDGVSLAQWVREAVAIRAAYHAGRRRDPDYERAIGRITKDLS
jgi:HicB family